MINVQTSPNGTAINEPRYVGVFRAEESASEAEDE